MRYEITGLTDNDEYLIHVFGTNLNGAMSTATAITLVHSIPHLIITWCLFFGAKEYNIFMGIFVLLFWRHISQNFVIGAYKWPFSSGA